jgi:hypothetical protein
MTIPGIRTNKRMVEQWPSYHDRPERPAHIRGQWPPQAPSIGKHAQLDMPGAWADRGLSAPTKIPVLSEAEGSMRRRRGSRTSRRDGSRSNDRGDRHAR